MADELIGKEFGHGQYKLDKKLGKGGMGTIYLANQPSLTRAVAVKVLPIPAEDKTNSVKRFRQEAEAAAKLTHNHIVPIIDYGVEDGYSYIVMQLVKSQKTLADYLRGKPLPLEQILRVINQIGDALEYAHSRRVVHRDVKPSNILVSNWGYYLLADFGIAKVRESKDRLTVTGVGVGTPAYMSPEQIRAKGKIDGRSDIYSLGVVLYEMAAGRLPFEAESEIGYISQHLVDDPLPPRQFNPNLPAALEEIILKAMAKNPDDRYGTPRAMAKRLRETVPVSVEGTRMLDDDTKPFDSAAKAGQPTDEQREQPGDTAPPSITSAQTSPSQSQPEEVPAKPLKTSSLEKAQLDTSEIEKGVNPAAIASSKAAMDTSVGEPPAKSERERQSTDKLIEPANPSHAVRMGTPPVNKQASRPVPPKPPTAPPDDPVPETIEPSQPTTSSQKKWLFIGGGAAGALILVLIVFGAMSMGGGGSEPPTPTSLPIAMLDETEDVPASDPVTEIITETSAVTDTTEDNPDPVEAEPEPVETVEVASEVAPAEEEEPEVETASEEEGAAEEAEAEEQEIENQVTADETDPEQVEVSDNGEPPVVTTSRDLSGKLAIPLLLGTAPKVYIVDTSGELLGDLGAARQPAYTLDGTQLVVNGDGGPENKLRVADPVGAQAFQIGDPGLGGHSHPFWSPDGSQVIYDDDTIDPAGWRIFIRGLNDAQGEGTILNAAAGPIIGQNPVWATQDRFIFRGCNTWANNPGECAMWLMQGNLGNPVKLTNSSNHIPTDVRDNTLVYVSAEGGNWNVYTLNLADNSTRQLTTDSAADGLATISPDGRSVAFLSERGGGLAVWQVAITGETPPEKMFDVPAQWGFLPPAWWTEDKMSWAN